MCGSSVSISFLLLAKPDKNPITSDSVKEFNISEVNNSVINTQSVVPISRAAFPFIVKELSSLTYSRSCKIF